jgi:hypothetical protein
MKPQNPNGSTDYQLARSASEGEEFLQDFFESVEIKFVREKTISGLKGDQKQYRVADFYLPQFHVYVEFLGLWNTIKNEEYKVKKEIYKLNKIPCVYIYPDNLGIIHYIFDKRIQTELSKNNLNKELFKYRFFKLKNSNEFHTRVPAFLGSAFFGLFIIIHSSHRQPGESFLLGIVSLIAIYQVANFIILYRKIFHKNKFTLENLAD